MRLLSYSDSPLLKRLTLLHLIKQPRNRSHLLIRILIRLLRNRLHSSEILPHRVIKPSRIRKLRDHLDKLFKFSIRLHLEQRLSHVLHLQPVSLQEILEIRDFFLFFEQVELIFRGEVIADSDDGVEFVASVFCEDG